MSEISLTASMRSNLLSLQQIAKLQDATQLRLSTGLKVNSAIDNPSSYYTASSLNNRAEDLSALLDSMGQSVQTIKAATEGIEKAEDLLSQMKAIAEQVNTGVYVPEKSYFEKLVGANGAVVTNAEELRAAVDSGKNEICVYGKIDLGDISTAGGLNLQTDQKLVGVNYYGNFGTEGEEFSGISATSSANNSMINITKNGCLVSDLSLNYENSECRYYCFAIVVGSSNVEAKLNNLNINVNYLEKTGTFRGGIGVRDGAVANVEGNISIETFGRGNIGIDCCFGNSVLNINNAYIDIKTHGEAAYGILLHNSAKINTYSNSVINIETLGQGSAGLYIAKDLTDEGTCNIEGIIKIKTQNQWGICIAGQGSGNVNIKSSAQIYFATGNLVSFGLNAANPNILDIAQGAKIAIEKNGQTKWYEVKADYHADTSTAAININASNIETTLNVAETNSWKMADEIIADYKKEKEENTTLLNEDEVASYQTQYNNALSQYDSLIKDSSYKGVNLLQADDLKVVFNETRSATLDVSGVDLSSDKIGMMTADWSKAKDVQNSINQVIEAKNTLRSASTKLGNYYSIITERETFTDNLINVLEEGEAKLTLEDMNEESANMLSLQTRQQLAINSLSLASQASQAVLRLF